MNEDLNLIISIIFIIAGCFLTAMFLYDKKESKFIRILYAIMSIVLILMGFTWK